AVPEDLSRRLLARVHLERELKRVEPHRPKLDEVGFVVKGHVAVLPKHVRRKYRDQADRDETLLEAVGELIEHGLVVSNDNLLKKGFGKQTVLDFRKRYPEAFDHPSAGGAGRG